MSGTLYVVATPIGNLSDISPRALEALAQSALIAAEDTRHTLKLLSHFNIHTRMISCHEYNEQSRAQRILQTLEEGGDVALVTDAGTPCISDPGWRITDAALDAGYRVSPIPGPSALTALLSACGFALDCFAFWGFPPRGEKERGEAFDAIRGSGVSVWVFYESPKRMLKLIKSVAEAFPGADACVASDLTKMHERIYRGAVETVRDELAANEKAELGEYAIAVKLPAREQPDRPPELSDEALLLDYAIRNDCTLKEATAVLSSKDLPRNRLYAAALRLKDRLESL